MDMSSGGHDSRSLLQERDDSRYSFLGPGRDSNDGFTTLRKCCPAHKVHLTTNSAELEGADRICTNLSGEVDFNG